MVQCVNCGTCGTVDDPDEQEWAEAFHAPSEPYRWDDDARVTVRGRGPLYVLKAGEGQGERTPSTTARRDGGVMAADTLMTTCETLSPIAPPIRP